MRTPSHAGALAGALAGHTDELRKLAWCLARNDGADDLVQDAFVVALSATPPRADRVRAWLRQVLRNELRMRVRRDRRRLARERLAVLDAHMPALDDVAVHDELVDAMHGALEELDDPYRSVVHARFLQGRAPDEISRDVGRPPATVRWQIHEGLRRIRASLDERYGDRQRWCGGAIALAAWPGREASRATGVTTMSKLALASWALGTTFGVGAVAVAINHSFAQPNEAAPPRANALPTEAADVVVPPPTLVLAASSEAVDAIADGSAASLPAPAPAEGCDGGCEGCNGGCDPEGGAPHVSGQVITDSQHALATVFASCEHLVPAAERGKRLEITVSVQGGSAELGNTIVGADATRGRKLPCHDPDADFDQKDGPDVVHLAALAECIEQSVEPDFVEALPEGERIDMTYLHEPAGTPKVDWSLPAASEAASKLDPDQAVASFDLPRIGATSEKAAKVSVVECGGYDCTYCKKARTTLDALQAAYGDALSLHFLQMPLDFQKTSALASRAAVAAANQGAFAKMHDALFEHPEARTPDALVELAGTLGLDRERFRKDLLAAETAQRVADEREVCMKAGAAGTPSFFINGDLLVGSQAEAAFREIIDEELADAK